MMDNTQYSHVLNNLATGTGVWLEDVFRPDNKSLEALVLAPCDEPPGEPLDLIKPYTARLGIFEPEVLSVEVVSRRRQWNKNPLNWLDKDYMVEARIKLTLPMPAQNGNGLHEPPPLPALETYKGIYALPIQWDGHHLDTGEKVDVVILKYNTVPHAEAVVFKGYRKDGRGLLIHVRSFASVLEEEPDWLQVWDGYAWRADLVMEIVEGLFPRQLPAVE